MSYNEWAGAIAQRFRTRSLRGPDLMPGITWFLTGIAESYFQALSQEKFSEPPSTARYIHPPPKKMLC